MGKRGGARVIYFNELEGAHLAIDRLCESKIRQPAGCIFGKT